MAEIQFENRMSDQDALMWSIEKDPLLRSTITTVSLLESMPDRDRFHEQMERASREVPRLRQRVATAPFGVAPPEYVYDEHFDLDYHVRWMKAPGDGSLRAILDMAAPFAMSGFDRARPLWEFQIVEDLAHDRTALVQKMHHALTDGVGAMKLSMAFLDTTPEGKPRGPMPEVPVAERPSTVELLREGIEHEARRQAGILRRLPGMVAGAARRPLDSTRTTLRTAGSTARMLKPVSDPLSPIMTGRSSSVRFDTVSASLPRMKAASKLVGGHLNDAFVAAVAGGLRRYHEHHGAPVERLRMTMPINIRPADGLVVAGNQFVPARFEFPVGIADPVERMAALHALVAEQRAEPALGIVEPLSGVLNRLPVSVTTSIFGSMLKAIDVVTSNVPGAPIPIYIAGAKLLANYGFGPLSGAASNITLLSYIDDLHLAVSTDPAAVPDPETFVSCIQDGVDEIEALA